MLHQILQIIKSVQNIGIKNNTNNLINMILIYLQVLI